MKENESGFEPERLAAYVDGELDTTARSEVEAWLQKNPEGRADVDGQRRLLRLWQSAPPVEPGAAAWSAVCERVVAGVKDSRRPRILPYRWLWGAVGLVAAAAAVLLALTLTGFWSTNGPEPPGDPFPVVSAEDVEILIMDDDDRKALVVGEPPVTGPLEVVSAGDVVVDSMEPSADGMVPRFVDDATVPMIWITEGKRP